jgi:hypothetical protein
MSMLLVVLVAVLLGWRIDKARRQARAVAVVQGLKGSLVFDYDMNAQGRYAPNSRPPRGPEWLHGFLGPEYFRTLETLWIHHSTTDSDYTFLQGLTELRTLHLRQTNITNDGLSCLRSMPHIWGLDLMSSPLVGDGSARYIAGLTGLKELYLNGTQFTDLGLTCVRGKKKLRTLFLQELRLTGVGLAHLQGLTQLERLILSKTQVNDAALIHLTGLTGLWELALDGTQVTDAGLVHLRGLSGLKTLNLEQTNVTEAGVAELQKWLPSTKITWGDRKPTQ